MDDLTKEFIAESQEGLDRMERCLTELEMRPDDTGLLGEIFRAVHTIKGTTGFLGFDRLEKLAHAGEHLLGSLRDGRLAVTSELISGLLHLLDGLRAILVLIEETGGEGTRSSDEDGELIAELALLNGAMPPAEFEPALLHAVVDTGVVSTPAKAADTALASGSANTERGGAGNDKTLRIDVDVLNRMMNLVYFPSRIGGHSSAKSTARCRRAGIWCWGTPSRLRIRPTFSRWSSRRTAIFIGP